MSERQTLQNGLKVILPVKVYGKTGTHRLRLEEIHACRVHPSSRRSSCAVASQSIYVYT